IESGSTSIAISVGGQDATSIPVAAPTVLPRRRRRLSRNEPAKRFACSTVASRLESKGPSGTITNLHQRPRFPAHARKIRVQARSGLAAWQQLVVAAYIEKHIA